MAIKVGVLTYKHLNALTLESKKYIDDDEIELVLVEGLMDELVDRVNTLYRQNKVEVFLGGGANGRYVKAHADVPLKMIEFGLFELLTAVTKAKKLGSRIGVAVYENTRCNIDLLRETTATDVVKINFRCEKELKSKLKSSGIDVVVGASLSNKIAAEIGLSSVLIYPGPESVAAAIRDAKLMAIEIRREKERQRLFQAVLEYTWGGVIATDRDGSVIAYNLTAEKLLGKPRHEILHKQLERFFPDIGRTEPTASLAPQIGHLRDINGIKVIVNRIPIVVSGEAAGSVTTFRKVSALQKAENSVRSKLADKGLRARARFENILGSSQIMRDVIQRATLFARSGLNVYLFGETGVGKELFAQSIHNESGHATGPFVAINCAALPESLLESELFGHEEGSFTGSRKGGKMGLFEMAHKGTLFLDEVSEIPPHIQARLLRVLQEREVMRIGGDRVIPIDVRIISASNRRLCDCVKEGTFREDLFYRLNVLQLEIPPLRDRPDDTIELFFHFLHLHHPDLHELGDPNRDVLNKIITRYSWPGNAREVQNVVERMSVLSHLFPKYGEAESRQNLLNSIGKDVFIDDYLRHRGGNEKVGKNTRLLGELCDFFHGETECVARQMGISRTTLWRRLSPAKVT